MTTEALVTDEAELKQLREETLVKFSDKPAADDPASLDDPLLSPPNVDDNDAEGGSCKPYSDPFPHRWVDLEKYGERERERGGVTTKIADSICFSCKDITRHSIQCATFCWLGNGIKLKRLSISKRLLRPKQPWELHLQRHINICMSSWRRFRWKKVRLMD